MKYQAPFGVSDPNAPYINGDPSIARKGSIPPAASIEHPQREIVGLISKSKFVPDDTDLLQLTKSARSQFINFADDTGSQNTLSVSFDPPLGAYTIGLPIRVRVKISNDGPCTIDAGAGRVNIRRPNGAALAQGDLTSGGLVDLVYDGTAFQMINFLGTGGGAGDVNNFFTNIPYAVDTSPIANSIVCSFTPAITTLAAGQPILVKIANNNTGPTTIKCNALAPVPVYATDDKPLLPCDVIAGGVFMMVFDGTTFIVPPFDTIIMPVTINIPSTQFNTPTALFNAFERKRIGQLGYLQVILAIGTYDPFVIYHGDASKIAIKGTMKAARPVLGNFSMSGNGPAQRSADAAFNLNMLRSRYGTEIAIPSGGGFGVQIRVGLTPSLSDMLITCGNTSVGSVGIGDQSCSCDNIAVWGCRSGIYADATGTILVSACWASACYFGFSAIHGGTMGFNDFTGSGSGAMGCDEAGFSAQAKGYLLTGPQTFSRCNGHYGYVASEFSMLSGTYLDGQYNGYSDFTAVNMSMIRFYGLIASLPSSPSIGYEGNNGSWIIGG